MAAVVFMAGATASPAASPAAETEARWAGWRGPGGAGVAQDLALPDGWSTQDSVLWKTPLPGRGHSSPIIWGDRLFLTADLEGDLLPGAEPVKHHRPSGEEYVHPDSTSGRRRHTLLVLALDAQSGALLWERTAYSGTVHDNRHRKNTYASATAVTDGERVYASFEAQGLYAYELDGEPVWKTSLGGIAKGGLGPGTSPVLYEDYLLLQCDQEYGEGAFIAAVDRRTGELAWRTKRRHRRSWATPILVRAGGATLLVASGRESVIAYDPETGQEVWEAEGPAGNAIPSPVAGAGLVFVTAGFPDKHTLALDPALGLDTSRRVAWRHRKGSGYVPSPIFYQDHLYLVDDKGTLTCLDALSGKVLYEGGRVPKPARFSASPIAFAGRLLLISEQGDVNLVRAGPEHEILAASSLGEPVIASPAIGGPRLYIRGGTHLFAFGLTDASPQPQPR